MSKTLGSIITLIGAVVVNVVPGLGQIASAAILLGSAALGAVVSSLDHGPRADKSEKPPQTEGAIKVPTPPRVSGYGRNRLYMAYTLFTTSANGTAVDVGVFHEGRVDGIERHYLGDKAVSLAGGYVVTGEAGQYGSNKVRIGTRLGENTETAFSEVIALVPDKWTTDHRGDGCATGFVAWTPVKVADYSKVYPGGGPDGTPLSLAMRLQRCFDWRDNTQSVSNPATWKWTENAILHLAHYLLVRDNKDWAVHFAPTLSYWTAAANVCDEAVPLAGVQTILMAAANHGATSLTVDSVNGLAPGMTITISATGDTSLIETRTVSGITGGAGAYVVAFSGGALMNDHPQGSQVTWSSSGTPATEARYRSCVAHKHTDEHKAVKAALLACCDGWLSPRADGALVVFAGKYVAPTGDALGPDDIISYSLQDGIDEENALNQLAISYVSGNHDFNVVDTDPWTDDDDISTRGKVLADTLANQVPSHSQARRLGKRRISQLMAPKRGTTSTNAAGRAKVIGKRYVRQQLVDAGTTFLDAVVEITKLTRNLATGGVTFEWILADPNVDAWNPATEEGLPAPVGNRVPTAPLDPPSISSAVVDFSAVADGGTGVRLTINAVGPSRNDLQWYVRWRVHGAVSWNEQQYVDTDPGAAVVLETAYVPTKSLVDVEVAYGTGDGRISGYSTAAVVDTSTDATPPDAAGPIVLVGWTNEMRLTTDRISRASTYRWRFYNPSNLTTPLRTIITTVPEVSYTSSQAAVDGIRRDYVVTVAGLNGGGAGTTATTATLTLTAPAAVTGVSATGGTGEATVSFTNSTNPAVSGYLVATSTAAGFDPSTQGSGALFAGTPAYLQNWAAGTYYAKAAAFDSWTTRASLLNFSTEVSFTTTGSSGGTGGGGGDGGGGYCVTIDTLVLMADGTERPAGDLEVGDMVRTQHESTFEWGDYPIEAITFAEMPVLVAEIGARTIRATADHPIWLGGAWMTFDAIGVPDGRNTVALITVADAHTYISAGVLSHNKTQYPKLP